MIILFMYFLFVGFFPGPNIVTMSERIFQGSFVYPYPSVSALAGGNSDHGPRKTRTKTQTTPDSGSIGERRKLRPWSEFLGRENSDHGLSFGRFWGRGDEGALNFCFCYCDPTGICIPKLFMRCAKGIFAKGFWGCTRFSLLRWEKGSEIIDLSMGLLEGPFSAMAGVP